MTNCLGMSCSFGLPYVSIVTVYKFVCVCFDTGCDIRNGI